jgi:hypothetical protein
MDHVRTGLQELYFENPWRADDLPSYVSVADDGAIAGFIGALPRTLRFGDELIRVVVAGSHMVDPKRPDPFAAIMLLRRLFSGPQDLTFSDTANSISRRLWEKMGGTTLLGLSTKWIRVLRPAGFSRFLLDWRYRDSARSFRRLIEPIAVAADSVLSPMAAAELVLPVRPIAGREFDPVLLSSALPGVTEARKVFPSYSATEASWLFSKLRENNANGSLVTRAFFRGKKPAGWYLMYAPSGSIAQVLQLAAEPALYPGVLGHLLKTAWKLGCLAVVGRDDPSHAGTLRRHFCFPFVRNPFVVAHSRRSEIMQALISGDAFVSRLEGEFWVSL